MRVRRRSLGTKKRNVDIFDALPNNQDAWEERPVEIEQAYRRGYYHGMVMALRALKDQSPEELEKFVDKELFAWRYQSRITCEEPPEPRQKKEKAQDK